MSRAKVLTGDLAGSVTITASASGLPDSNDLTFTVVAGAVSEVDLTGSTANLTSGATRVLTATLKDAAGNVRTADNSTVVTFAKSGGAGTVTGLGNDTASCRRGLGDRHRRGRPAASTSTRPPRPSRATP